MCYVFMYTCIYIYRLDIDIYIDILQKKPPQYRNAMH